MSAVLKPAGLRFRPMCDADLSVVLDIEQTCYEFPWTRGIFRDCLRVGYACWVAELDGVIHGYGFMAVGAGEAHILNICVHPGTRRQGIGRAILDHLIDRARGLGAEMVLLEVRPSNAIARRLYRESGFCEVGLRRGYYPARTGREDALILAMDLE